VVTERRLAQIYVLYGTTVCHMSMVRSESVAGPAGVLLPSGFDILPSTKYLMCLTSTAA
jgi:hypothetical protein